MQQLGNYDLSTLTLSNYKNTHTVKALEFVQMIWG